MHRPDSLARWLALGLAGSSLGAGACVGPTPTDATTMPTAAPASAEASVATIAWHPWSPEAFEHARQDGRLILIDVGIEGCTACRWMDERTYRDPAVARRIEEHFVAIAVDAEARPDIGERYSAWGWPATIVMTPDAQQVLAIRGNKLPRNFIPILDELVAAQRAGTLTADGSAPLSVPPNPDPAELGVLRRRVVDQLDRAYHDTGGWGRKQKLPLGPNLAHALMRAHTREPDPWRRRSLHTLIRYASLIDPVWGGVFVGAVGEHWDRIIPEKRIAGQAAALSGFARAHQLTGDARWLDHARQIDRYVSAFMLSPEGGFYTSQEDDAPRLPPELDAFAYYTTLDDEGRRAYGTPPVDHVVYTDKNGLMISAYVDLFEASGDPTALARATRAAERMLERQRADGLFDQHDPRQSLSDERMRALPTGERRYLRPQGPMGLALLDLFRVTAEPRWLEAARRLAGGLPHLEDPEQGGFYAVDDSSTDAIVGRRKPLSGNATAARFLFELGVYERNERDEQAIAERAVRVVSVPTILAPEGRLAGELALTLEWMTAGAVEMSILGDPADPRTEALRAAAAAVYEPRKVLHYEPPGRYPDVGHPVLYVCSDEACSTGIAQPELVAAEVAKFAHNRAE